MTHQEQDEFRDAIFIIAEMHRMWAESDSLNAKLEHYTPNPRQVTVTEVFWGGFYGQH